MKYLVLCLALLPLPAMAETPPEEIAALRIAQVIDTACKNLVLQPGLDRALGAMMGGAGANRSAMMKIGKATEAAVKEFDKKHGVQVRRPDAALCKAGAAELKSGTAIGRMLKRK